MSEEKDAKGEIENFLDSSSETKAKDGETQPSAGGEKTNTADEKLPPFNEHPRWQEMLEKNRKLESEVEDLRKTFEPLKNTLKPQEEIPRWFGGDQNQWKEFKSWADQIEERAASKIEAKQKAESERMQQGIKEANAHFERSVAEIEATGQKVDKNLLLKVAQDYSLVDTQGRWNYKAAAQIIKAQGLKVDKEGINAKKRIFSTEKENVADQGKKDYMTNEDFQRFRPW